MADARKTSLQQRPCGIIRIAALCVLCRYRHKSHASGHHSRLNRDLTGSFGSRKYAFEELIAEISAAYLCASLSIIPTVRHADYIASWLEVLREDDRAIVRAASAASKAADFILGFQPDAPQPVAATSADDEREAA
jgi:antirestriction protein ArdC